MWPTFQEKETADPYHNITVYGQTSIATNAFIYRKSNFEFVLKPSVVSTHNVSLTCRTRSTTKMAGSQLWCLLDFTTLAKMLGVHSWSQPKKAIESNWIFQLDPTGSNWTSAEADLPVRLHEKSISLQLGIMKNPVGHSWTSLELGMQNRLIWTKLEVTRWVIALNRR